MLCESECWLADFGARQRISWQRDQAEYFSKTTKFEVAGKV